VPGVTGMLLLDVATTVALLPQVFAANGYAAVELAIPPQPTLIGAQVAFQVAWVDGAGAHLGGNAQVAVVQ
jgi:hypothetical protein